MVSKQHAEYFQTQPCKLFTAPDSYRDYKAKTMHPNFIIKSVIHAIATGMTIGYALVTFQQHVALATLLLFAGVAMCILIFLHGKLMSRLPLKTSLFFLFESIVLAIIAWQLYRHGLHKATFFYEGFSIFFLCLSAFALLLRKKRHVLFSEEEIKPG